MSARKREVDALDENPYLPPKADASNSNASATVTSQLQESAKTRLSRPATALIIMASIHSVFIAIIILPTVFGYFRGIASGEPVRFVLDCIHFVCLIMIAIGAAKMGFLESLRMARVGAALACVPLVSPFYLLGIPFGIWAIYLLAEEEIQAAFAWQRAR